MVLRRCVGQKNFPARASVYPIFRSPGIWSKILVVTQIEAGTRILRVDHGPEARATLENASLPKFLSRNFVYRIHIHVVQIERRIKLTPRSQS